MTRAPRLPALLASVVSLAGAALTFAAPQAFAKLSFGALSDWGGQTASPFTTVGQVAAAEGLARVAATEKPSLVLLA